MDGRQEGFLKDAIESLAYPFYVVNTETYMIEMANAASGLQIGRVCHEQTHRYDTPCDEKREICPIKAVKETGKPVVLEHVHFDPEGRQRYVEIHGYPIFDDQGKITRMIEYYLDVTERKQAEVLLRRRVEVERMINLVSTRFLRIDPAETDGEIESALRLVGRFTGADRSFVFRVNPDGGAVDNTHEWCADGIGTYIERMKNVDIPAFFSGKMAAFETVCVRRLSELPPEAGDVGALMEAHGLRSLLCAPMTYRKETIGFLGALTLRSEREWTDEDIRMMEIIGNVFTNALMRKADWETLNRSYEEVLQLKEKAESANRLKSQFLANVSHDIRTPLNAVSGFTDLLLKDEKRAVQRGYLEHIKKSGEGLLNLITDILDFSKIEAGQLDIVEHPFRITEVTESLRSLFDMLTREKDIDFELNISRHAPAVICNDRWRINQVLTNLLSNAVKFTDEGRVALRVGYKASKDRVVFDVSDTGTGIPPEHMDRIFEAFAQVHAGDTWERKGAGLGLAICKRLTRLMGGEVTVFSTPGEGSSFTVEIPAHSDRVTDEVLEEPPPEDTVERLFKGFEEAKHRTILIAEDNPVNRKLLLEQLRSVGFTSLLTVSNGAEAVESALAHQPDLVLMDIHMPVMDGHQALVELKHRGYEGPVVMLSAYAMPQDIDKNMAAGAAGYITKPINFDTFFSRIGAFLKGKKKPGTDTHGVNTHGVNTHGVSTESSGPDKKADKKAAKKNERRGKDNHRIGGVLSRKMQVIYLTDMEKNAARITGILYAGELEKHKKEVRKIIHGYAGNAGYFNLTALETAAKELDLVFLNDDSDPRLPDMTRRLLAFLNKTIDENKKLKEF